MTFSYLYAVLTCVSSEAQAEDRASLDDQLANAKRYGDTSGGTFTREFRADGYSRSGYYDLTKAFTDIPPLKQLADFIDSSAADVVIVDSYDRLGSVAFAFWEWLKPRNIQFRSVQQPLPIVPPKDYKSSKDDSTTNMIVTSMMIQGYRINKITRAFEIGNLKRARDGKYSTQVPHGYIKLSKDEVKLDPQIAALLGKFPEWFLSGMAINEMVKRANESGVPAPKKRWHYKGVQYILQNPFYAGKTFYQRGKWVKGTYVPRKDAQMYDGNHEAIWSWDTHLKILDEFKRRKDIRGSNMDYNFSGLIACSVCGNNLYISYSTQRQDKKFWRCDTPGHVSIRADRANRMVADELRRLFSDDKYFPPPKVEDVRDYSRRELAELNKREARLVMAYETTDAYTPQEFAIKRREIQSRREELENEQAQMEQARREAETKRDTIRSMRDLLPHLLHWLEHDDPKVVKFHLSRVVRLTAYPDKTIKAEPLG